MAKLLLTCRGFPLGGCFVPAFELRRADIVTLQLPARFEMTNRLASHLSGSRPRPEVDLRGRCIVAGRAEAPAGWRRWFCDPYPSEWLVRQSFTRAEAAAALDRHSIEDRFRLSQYAAGPRAVLGLEAAMHAEPDIVIFNTSGLDPRWEVAVQELVRSNLPRMSAIYLATPFLSDGSLHLRAMPGSVVLEISPQSPAAV